MSTAIVLNTLPDATTPPMRVDVPHVVRQEILPPKAGEIVPGGTPVYGLRNIADYDASIVVSGTATSFGSLRFNKISAGYILTVMGGMVVAMRGPETTLKPQYKLAPELSDLYELRAPRPLQDDAKSLIGSAKSAGWALPKPRLTDDGEIMFYARKGRVYLDLGVHGDGTYSFFCRDADDNEFYSDDDVRVSVGLDKNVLRVLSQLV